MRKVNAGRVRGLDAYELAVKYKDFNGSLTDWLESLKGSVKLGDLSERDVASIVEQLLELGVAEKVIPTVADDTTPGLIKASDDISIMGDGSAHTHFITDVKEGTIISSKKSQAGSVTISSITGHSVQNKVSANKNRFYSSNDMSNWITMDNSFFDFTFDKDENTNTFGVYTLAAGLDCIYTPMMVTPGNTYTLSTSISTDETYTTKEDYIAGISIQIMGALPTDENVNNVTVGENDLLAIEFHDKNTKDTSIRKSLVFTPTTNIVYLVYNFGKVEYDLSFNCTAGKIQLEDGYTSTLYVEPTIPSPTLYNPSRFLSLGETKFDHINLLDSKFSDFNSWNKYPDGYNFAKIYFLDNMSKFEVRNETGKECAYLHLRVNKSSIYTFSYVYSIFDEYDIMDGRTENCVQIFDRNPFENTMNVEGEDVDLTHELTVGKNGLRGISFMSSNLCSLIKNSLTFTTDTGDLYVVFNFGGIDDTDNLYTFGLGEFQLEYGSILSDYEPYDLSYNIMSGIDIKSCGVNLANLVDNKYYVDGGDGIGIRPIIGDTRDWDEITNYSKLKGNTEYTVICLDDNLVDYEFGIFGNIVDKIPYTTISQSNINAGNTYTFSTIADSILKGKFWVEDLTSPNNIGTKIMVVEGRITDVSEIHYESYKETSVRLNKTLRALDDEVLDEYNIETNGVVRRIGDILLEGDTNLVKYYGEGINGSTIFSYENINIKPGSVNCACDVLYETSLENITNTVNSCAISDTEHLFLMNIDNSLIGIDPVDSQDTKADKCNEWFDINPIKIYFPLNQIQYEYIGEPVIAGSFDNYTQIFIGNTDMNTKLQVNFNSKALGLTNIIGRILGFDTKELSDVINTVKENSEMEYATKEDIDRLFTSTRAAQLVTVDGRFIVTSTGDSIITGN